MRRIGGLLWLPVDSVPVLGLHLTLLLAGQLLVVLIFRRSLLRGISVLSRISRLILL